MIERRKIEGRWWVLGEAEDARYGVLEFDPDEGLHLETKDARENAFSVFVRDSANKVTKAITILGRDQHNNPITLFFCSRAGGGSSAGLDTSRYHALYALIGRDFKAWKDVQFHSVELALTHMQGWIGQTMFSNPQSQDGIEQVRYTLFKETSYRIDDTATIKIASGVTSQFSSVPEDMVKLVGKHCIVLEWQQPLHIETINKWVVALCRLFSLSVGSPAYIRFLKGYRADHFIDLGEKKIEEGIEVLHSNSNAASVKEKHHPLEMLFSFSDVKDSFGDLVQRWLRYGEKFDAVLDLYFSIVFNRRLYINHQFLFLAQALERYHAVQTGGRKFFIRRLGELVDARRAVIGDLAAEFPNFPHLVKDTRNYYTHYDANLLAQGGVAQRLDLVRLVEVMKIMLEVLFLDDLGIGGAAIQRAKAKGRRATFIEIGRADA